MDTKFIQNIKDSVVEQRKNLVDWLSATPDNKKQIRLGLADEQDVQSRLNMLDTVIEKAENQTLGLCEICNDTIEPGLLEMDYTCCVCLDHLSEEEKDRLEIELEMSAEVQQALLPQQAPDIPGLELAAFSRPFEYIGGDYFDFFQFRDGAHGLVIGDVVGHGISASLLMASLQASLQTLVQDHDSPAEVIQRLNLLFNHNIRINNFVTLFIARFDSQSYELTYSNAGHNPPLLLRAKSEEGQQPFWLLPNGAAIGLVEEIEYKTDTVALQPGDTLLLYTDGVSEATNAAGEEFGKERLADLVKRGSSQTAQAIIADVRRSLEDFSQGQVPGDDMTILAGKLK